MKVIDLLNKIANGEIHYSRKFRFTYEEYCTATQFFERYIVDKDSLNMEIKELEDTSKEDKKIEKIEERIDTGLVGTEILDDFKVAGAINKQASYTFDIAKKLNEIIEVINERNI